MAKKPQLKVFSGYRIQPQGLSIWPFRKVSRPWSDLLSIETVVDFSKTRQFISVWKFRGHRPISFRQSKAVFGLGSPGRFAELLALAIPHLPSSPPEKSFTHLIAEHGSRSHRAQLKRLKISSSSEHLRLAHNQFAWLEFEAATKSAKRSIERDPTSGEAYELLIMLTGLTRAPLAKSRRLAEQWHRAQPNNSAATETLLHFNIQSGYPAALEEAHTKLLEQPFPSETAVILGGYLASRKRWEEAADVWELISLNEPDLLRRNAAQTEANNLRRLGRSRLARAKLRAKKWSGIAIAVLPLVAFVGAGAWNFWQKSRFNERHQDYQERHEERMAEHREQMRETEELIGEAFGTYEEVKARADRGEALAVYTLAVRLLEGKQGAPLDPVLGEKLLRQAAEQGHPKAMRVLGQRLIKEYPDDQERTTEGLAWLQKTAEGGSGRAALVLGELYNEGEVVPQDLPKAFAMFELSANNGNRTGAAWAGWMLQEGEGVDQDEGRAMDFYRIAADKNHRWSQERLYELLSRNRLEPGRQEEIWSLLEKGATNGSERLSFFYFRGLFGGVVSDLETQTEAIELVEKNAPEGIAGSAYVMAQLHRLGWQREQNFTEAFRWFEIAADRGFEPAKSFLTEWTAYGVGTPRDLAKAETLLASIDQSKISPEALDELKQRLESARIPISNPVSSETEKPIPAWQKAPIYPGPLRRQGIEGNASVRFFVDPEGFTQDVTSTKATHPEFAKAAIEAVKFWRLKVPLDPNTGLSPPQQVPIIFSISD